MLKRILFSGMIFSFLLISSAHAEDKSLSELLEDVKSFSGRVRAGAIASIGETVDVSMIKKNHIIKLLMGVLKNDPNLRVRREALAVFSNLATKGLLAKEFVAVSSDIIAIAVDEEEQLVVRRDAIRIIPKLLNRDNLEYDLVREKLLLILDDKKASPILRAQSLKSLAEFGGEKNLNIIMDFLKSKEEGLAAAAVLALGNMSEDVSLDKRNLNRIVSIIKDVDDDDVLVVILRAISRVSFDERSEKIVKNLVKQYISSDNDDVAIYAAVIAQNIGNTHVIPIIAKRLSQPFDKIEDAIRLVDVLAGFSDKLSSETDSRKLRANLKDLKLIYTVYANLLEQTDNAELGAALAWVYGDIPPLLDRNKAFDDLVGLLSVEGPIGMAALNSLKMITGELYGLDVEKWQMWQKKNEKILKAKKIK